MPLNLNLPEDTNYTDLTVCVRMKITVYPPPTDSEPSYKSYVTVMPYSMRGSIRRDENWNLWSWSLSFFQPGLFSQRGKQVSFMARRLAILLNNKFHNFLILFYFLMLTLP